MLVSYWPPMTMDEEPPPIDWCEEHGHKWCRIPPGAANDDPNAYDRCERCGLELPPWICRALDDFMMLYYRFG